MLRTCEPSGDWRGVVPSIATRLGTFRRTARRGNFGLRLARLRPGARDLTVRKSYGDDTVRKAAHGADARRVVDALNRWQTDLSPTAEGVGPLSHDKNAGGGWHKTSRRRPEITKPSRAAICRSWRSALALSASQLCVSVLQSGGLDCHATKTAGTQATSRPR